MEFFLAAILLCVISVIVGLKEGGFGEKAKETFYKTIKPILIGLIIIAAVVFLIVIIRGFANSSDGDGSGNGEKCKNCGRETDLVAGFGYCGSCYEGFVEWQDKNYK